jgi:hypothetical protein
MPTIYIVEECLSAFSRKVMTATFLTVNSACRFLEYVVPLNPDRVYRLYNMNADVDEDTLLYETACENEGRGTNANWLI